MADQAAAVAARATWRARFIALTEHAAAVDALVAIISTDDMLSPTDSWAIERLETARQQVETCWWLHFGEAPPATLP
jgi:hypothetical protein